MWITIICIFGALLILVIGICVFGQYHTRRRLKWSSAYNIAKSVQAGRTQFIRIPLTEIKMVSFVDGSQIAQTDDGRYMWQPPGASTKIGGDWIVVEPLKLEKK